MGLGASLRAGIHKWFARGAGRVASRVGALIALAALGAAATPAIAQSDLRYAYPQQLSVSPLGVNLQTGRFTQSVTDIAIGDLQFARSWGDTAVYTGTGRMFGIRRDTPSYVTGWVHNFSQGVHFETASQFNYQVTIAGAAYRFTINSSGGFMPFNRTARGSDLVRTGAVYDLTTASGDQHRFDVVSGNDARITWTIKADGTRWDYTYNGAGRLHQIRSSRGFAIVLDYDGFGNVSAACGFNLAQEFVPTTHSCSSATLRASYGYDASGNELRSITDVGGAVTSITGYASLGGPLCITEPNSSTCAITNTYGLLPSDPPLTNVQPDMVRIQTTPAGGIWAYQYELGENIQDFPVVPGRPRWSASMMTDPSGAVTNLRYDRGVLVELISPAGMTTYRYENLVIGEGQQISFDYHAVQPSLVTLPGGVQEYYLYNGRGDVILRSQWPVGAPEPTLTSGGYLLHQTDPDLRACCTYPGTANIPAGAVSFGQAYLADFPAGHPYPRGCGTGPAQFRLCNRPIARIDALGNQTDYTYDPAHGGVLTETGPPDAKGIRPQTRYSYNQRNAWLRTSGGGYTPSPYPVWLLTRRASCRTTAAGGSNCVGGAADEMVTLYDYGPDNGPSNLLLRGIVEDANGAAIRTCYGYDARANRISETRPGAGLTACP